MIEDIKYLIHRVSQKSATPFLLHPNVTLSQLPAQDRTTLLLTMPDYQRLGAKRKLGRVQRVKGKMVFFSVKLKYERDLFYSQPKEVQMQLSSNLLLD